MRVSEVMTSEPTSIHPDATLKEAARKMKDQDLGCLPVIDGSKIKGMITDRDLVVRAMVEGKDPKKASVREAMTSAVQFVYEDEDLEEATRRMSEHQIRRMLVLNRDQQLVGILSLGDLAVKAGDRNISGHVLENVSQDKGSHLSH